MFGNWFIKIMNVVVIISILIFIISAIPQIPFELFNSKETKSIHQIKNIISYGSISPGISTICIDHLEYMVTDGKYLNVFQILNEDGKPKTCTIKVEDK